MRQSPRLIVGLVIAVSALVVLAPHFKASTEGRHVDATSAKPSSATAEVRKQICGNASCEANVPAREIRRTTFEGSWPLKAETVVLRCHNGPRSTAIIDGVEYALNGTAIAAGFPEVPYSMRLPDEGSGDGRSSVAQLVPLANALCGAS